MRPAHQDLLDFLLDPANTEFDYADCFTIELVGGTDDNYRLRYTNAQQDLTVVPVGGGPGYETYRADRVMLKGLRSNVSIGLEVDEQEITLSPFDDDVTVQGVPILQAVAQGIFDGAIITRDRFYFERFGQAPIGNQGVPLFYGEVSTFTRVGRTSASLKVKAETVRLNIGMPRFPYQPGCIWTLFDDGCGLVKDDFAVPGVVGPGATAITLPWVDADPTFALGTVFFENMGVVGTRRTIRSATSSELVLAYPLPEVPPDTTLFVAYPGCNRTRARCTALGNDRFLGYPYIPQAEKAV